MRTLKRLRVPAALVLAILLVSCAGFKPPPDTSPELVPLIQAREAIVALGTTSRTAIALNAIEKCQSPATGPQVCEPLLSEANTRHVLDAVEDGILTIRKVPDGWKATSIAALDRVSKRLDDAGKDRFIVYVDAAKLIINGIK